MLIDTELHNKIDSLIHSFLRSNFFIPLSLTRFV